MQEIEILAELHDPIEKALDALKNFPCEGIKITRDVYYHDPLRNAMAWNGKRLDACCRIREQDETWRVTYKTNHFDGAAWLYADEYETTVENGATLQMIFAQLGLQELVVVETTRHVFVHHPYEITIDDVRDLGVFMEVEYKGKPDPSRTVQDIKAEILDFMQSLGLHISLESTLGKPELLLSKKDRQAKA